LNQHLNQFEPTLNTAIRTLFRIFANAIQTRGGAPVPKNIEKNQLTKERVSKKMLIFAGAC